MEDERRKKALGPGQRGFRKLPVWQKADQLASSVFQALLGHPVPPWLTAQATRAAVSVPANIAEGYARGSLRDYLRFLDIARGSLAELEYYLHFMEDNRLLEPSACAHLGTLAVEVGNLLVALIRSLRLKLQEGSWDRARVSEDPAAYDYLPPSTFLLPGEEP